jgi:hypothetical protein
MLSDHKRDVLDPRVFKMEVPTGLDDSASGYDTSKAKTRPNKCLVKETLPVQHPVSRISRVDTQKLAEVQTDLSESFRVALKRW